MRSYAEETILTETLDTLGVFFDYNRHLCLVSGFKVLICAFRLELVVSTWPLDLE
jgi:hypothetical protein